MALTAPGFGQHFLADEQSELDPHPGKSDALSSALRAGGEVVIAGQLPPLHAGAVVRHRERGLSGIRIYQNSACPGIERVGHDFGEDRLLDRAGVSIAQVFKEVEQVNARFAHFFLPYTRIFQFTAGSF